MMMSRKEEAVRAIVFSAVLEFYLHLKDHKLPDLKDYAKSGSMCTSGYAANGRLNCCALWANST
jgi:hypothetical protein